MPSETTLVLPDSRPIHRLIRRTRRLLRSSWIATGLNLSIGLGLGTLVVLTLIDLFAPLPPITWTAAGHVLPVASLVRLLALLLVVVPAAWTFFVGVVRPLFRRMAAVQVARRIESHIPNIHNRLVSCLDLESKGKRSEVSPIFYRRLLTEALERIRGFRPGVVLDYLSLRRAMLFALAASLSFVLLCCLFSDRAVRAMARIFRPFADLPPISRVVYTVEPGDADMLREEPIPFTVRVASDADPQELRLELYNDAGLPPYKYELMRDKDDPKLWKITVDGGSLGEGYEDGFRYRVFGGETWSVQHRIRLVERPVLLSVDSAVYYPKYMGIPEPQPTPPQAVEVTGPEGGEVEVRVEARGQVADGEIQMLRSVMRPIPRRDQVEEVWFEDKPPLGAAREGTWRWERCDGRPAHTEPPAIGTHRHWFQGAPAGHVVGNNDVLFAYVFIPAQNAPETIMLQWHDGESWEHGAYWGADRIREFKANTAARRHVGELPAAGRWVRLEVPAGQVGLEGKTIRGMAFILHGGQCFWGRTGTVHVEEPDVEVVKTYPMRQVSPTPPSPNLGEGGVGAVWIGRFPLVGAGLFRTELRNRQGHANKPMKELKYVSLPDQPPQVVLERYSNETVLSKPAALPLSIKAFDDYGLAEINLLMRDGEKAPYRSRLLRRYQTPKRDDSLVSSLTEAASLKQGGVLRYAIEAKDRKGQIARTREYVVRIAADFNAADQQLTRFEKTQDAFRDRLVKLIAEQKKVQDSMKKLDKEYTAMTEKVREQAEIQPQENKLDRPQTAVKDQDKTPKLDPETAKRLAQLRKQLDQLAKEEEKNASQAQQMSKDLAMVVKHADKLEMLPKPIAEQMQATQQMFQYRVADALHDLGRQMHRDADAKQTPAPDLKNLHERGERVQKEMEGIKDRLDALANARKGMREDLRKALEQLQRDLLKETGKLTQRELEQLRAFIAKMREQMKRLQDRQDALAEEAMAGKDAKRLKREQEDLDRQIEEMLARARKLLGDRRRKADKPEFPESPYTPDGEVKVPPREEDTNEPPPGEKDKDGKDNRSAKKDKKADAKDDEEEPLFKPALGGPKPKIDPRFAKKRRPVKPKDGENERRHDLQSAHDSLASDQQTLEQMLQQLAQAMQSKTSGGRKPPVGQPNDSEADAIAQQLQQMLQSPAVQAALAMAQRMRQAQAMGKPQQGQPSQSSSQSAQGNLQGGHKNGRAEADLSKLDPDTRALILKLPPSRLREELIQGMNEQGPQAYRAFIRDYFKRLTETKKSK